MRTILLPGFSAHNLEWAKEVKEKVKLSEKIIIHEWRHWTKGGGLVLKYETAGIIKKIGQERKVNIIAKSVGIRVCLTLLVTIPEKLNQIILCGVPTISDAFLDLAQKALNNIDPKMVTVIQNTADPLASFAKVYKLIQKVNPKIKVIEKEGENHSYPYFADFEQIFT